MLGGNKRRQALLSLATITAIATDYIYDEADTAEFSRCVADIALYLKDPKGDKIVELATQVHSDRHANNSSPIVGGEADD